MGKLAHRAYFQGLTRLSREALALILIKVSAAGARSLAVR